MFIVNTLLSFLLTTLRLALIRARSERELREESLREGIGTRQKRER